MGMELSLGERLCQMRLIFIFLAYFWLTGTIRCNRLTATLTRNGAKVRFQSAARLCFLNARL